MKKNGKGQAKALSFKEEERLVAAMAEFREGIRNIALFKLGVNTGLRINELRTLDIVDVRNGKKQIRKKLIIKGENTKNRQSRTIDISEEAAKALNEYLKTRPDAKPDDPLFKSCGRGRISRSMCIRMFEQALDKAGIAGASSHSLRRAYATREREQGKTLAKIAKVLGHSSIETTATCIEEVENETVEAKIIDEKEKSLKPLEALFLSPSAMPIRSHSRSIVIEANSDQFKLFMDGWLILGVNKNNFNQD